MSDRHVSPVVRFAVERRVTMAMVVLGVFVLGAISLKRLPLEFLPAFSSSNISASVPYPSSSPDEVDRLIVQPLEASLGTINGIETLSSNASSDEARVSVRFLDGTDMDMAAVDVRDRVERVRALLPDDVERVWIRRFQSTDIPVLRFDLSAPWPDERLYEFAETVVQRRLERLEGVAQVDVDGIRTPELRVEIDPARMRAHGVAVRDVAQAIGAGNVNVSGGEIRDGGRALLVRSVGEFDTPDEVGRLPIPTGDTTVHLDDIADVIYDFPRQEEYNFLNGVESLTVAINKASTANLLAVVDRVKAEMAVIEGLPEAAGQVRMRVYSDASKDVRQGLGQLRDAGLIGGLLAIAAVFVFLRRFRTTSLVALAIPVSVVTTFVLIYFLRQAGAIDITLNVVSLAGLMLALGMLVDNSIVVIESIFRHRNELEEDAVTAALRGASEVALPITASTITTICVFLPMIFMGSGGRFKLYFSNIGITVCIVIVASLGVALTVVPMASAIILRSQSSRNAPFIDRMIARYGGLLRFTLRHRAVFVLSIMIMLGGVIWLFSTIERSFSGRPLEREVVIKIDTPRQYSFEQIEALYDRVYELLDARRDELDVLDISHTYDRGTGRARGGWGRNRQISLYLADEEDSALSTADVRDRVRALLPVEPGVELRIAAEQGRGDSSGIEIQLMGEDRSVLELLADQVAGRLATAPGVKDVDTSLESGDEEIHVGVQRERALQAGLSSQAVARTVSTALTGRAVGNFHTGDREVDLVVQFREEDRQTLDQLRVLPVRVADADVPLGALASFDVVAGPRAISRENRQSVVTVTANTEGGRASFAAMGMAQRIMAETPIPPGFEWSFGRWNRWAQQDQASGLFALLFALPLVYMVLAALFESLVQPFTIMVSVPFAALGVGVVMKLAGQPWDTMSMLGMIVLLGVVVNNAIVLIDHINRLRREGLSRDEAIVRGGQHRLRPILITAVTTILGMMPLVAPFLWPGVFGSVEGRAASWAPIGLVIVGGLTTSTFLTLVIIPTVYSLVDDAARFARRVVRSA